MTVAGVLCVALAIGHATLGLVWVLPAVSVDRRPSPFGSLSAGIVHVSWHVVTIFALSFGGALLSVAAGADPRAAMLRWIAAGFLGATAMVAWRTRTRPARLLRMPVPMAWVAVAALCLRAV